ncbi:unnamed protein product, partial [Trichobilharzia regenti]
MELGTIGPITLDSTTNCTDLHRGQNNYQSSTLMQRANLNTCNMNPTVCDYYNHSVTQHLDVIHMDTDNNNTIIATINTTTNNNNKMKYNQYTSISVPSTNTCTLNNKYSNDLSNLTKPLSNPLLSNDRLTELITNRHQEDSSTGIMSVNCSNDKALIMKHSSKSTDQYDQCSLINKSFFNDYNNLTNFTGVNPLTTKGTTTGTATATAAATSVATTTSGTTPITSVHSMNNAPTIPISRTPSPSTLTDKKHYQSSEMEYAKFSNVLSDNHAEKSSKSNENNNNGDNNENSSKCEQELYTQSNLNQSMHRKSLLPPMLPSGVASSISSSCVSSSCSSSRSSSSSSPLYRLNQLISTSEPSCYMRDVYTHRLMSIPVSTTSTVTTGISGGNNGEVGVITSNPSVCLNYSEASTPLNASFTVNKTSLTQESTSVAASSVLSYGNSISNNTSNNNNNVFHLQNPHSLTGIENSKFSVQSHLEQLPLQSICTTTNVTYSTHITSSHTTNKIGGTSVIQSEQQQQQQQRPIETLSTFSNPLSMMYENINIKNAINNTYLQHPYHHNQPQQNHLNQAQRHQMSGALPPGLPGPPPPALPPSQQQQQQQLKTLLPPMQNTNLHLSNFPYSFNGNITIPSNNTTTNSSNNSNCNTLHMHNNSNNNTNTNSLTDRINATCDEFLPSECRSTSA